MKAIQQCKIVQMEPAGTDANGTTNYGEIDCQGFDHLTIMFRVENIAANMTSLALVEDDASPIDGSSTAISGSDATAFLAASDDNKHVIFNVPLMGRKRFIGTKLVAGAGATVISVVGILTGRSDGSVSDSLGATARGAKEIIDVT